MRSTTGKHYPGLDHLRAFAAFLVFAWHFMHTENHPVPFDEVPNLAPFSILDEGHTGVALFMTLSGYLFAKLLAGKRIDYFKFLYNRGMRLLPLLLVVMVFAGLLSWHRGRLWDFLGDVSVGLVMPSLPNGGWSITVEFHFYLLLPLLLYLARKNLWNLLMVLAAFVGFRYAYHAQTGSVQELAYWTIVGRMDQFVLGMLAAFLMPKFQYRAWLATCCAIGLSGFYHWFNHQGGYQNFPSYPSPSAVWVWLPTVEGLCYAGIIAWYDHWQTSRHWMSRAVGKIGEFSYSIYLIHTFVVFKMANVIHAEVMPISNFYLALLWCIPCFLIVAGIAGISYHLIELPFLKKRRNYLIEPESKKV